MLCFKMYFEFICFWVLLPKLLNTLKLHVVFHILIALVKMAQPAILNEHVSLVCEAHAGWSFPVGMECVVTGWGVTVEGEDVLRS